MKAMTNSIRGPLETADVLRRQPSAPNAISVTLAMALALAAMYVALTAFGAGPERSAGIEAEAVTMAVGSTPSISVPSISGPGREPS